MLLTGIRRAVVVALALAMTSVLPGCASTAAPPGSAPAVSSARAYAQTLPEVLAGGDVSALSDLATPEQIERVGRYRLLLEKERGQLLALELKAWTLRSAARENGLWIIRADETWLTQPLDAETREAAGQAGERRILTEYRVRNVGAAWLVDDLTELQAVE